MVSKSIANAAAVAGEERYFAWLTGRKLHGFAARCGHLDSRLKVKLSRVKQSDSAVEQNEFCWFLYR